MRDIGDFPTGKLKMVHRHLGWAFLVGIFVLAANRVAVVSWV